MLKHLHIKNYILIDEIDIEFDDGLNIIYGETGAGKSILVSALNLLKGQRTSFDHILDESKKALIEATFILTDDFIKTHPILKDYLDSNELIISRSLLPSKTSQIRINGELITLSELEEIAKDVIDITSSGSSFLLRTNEYQKNLLDKYIVSQIGRKSYDDYNAKYDEYLKAIKAKEEYLTYLRTNDIDSIRFKLEKLSKYNIKDNEYEDLKEEAIEAEKYSKNLAAYSNFEALDNDESFHDIMYKLTKCFNDIDDEDSQELISYIDEIRERVSHYASKSGEEEKNLQRVDYINSRIFELQPLIREYGSSHAVIQTIDELTSRLDEVTNSEDHIKSLDKKVEAKRAECYKLAKDLSSIRKEHAKKIDEYVQYEMKGLSLKEDGFKIDFAEKELSSSGIDEIEMLVCLNKGMGFKPLCQTASFGETSRLLIALIASLNKLAPIDTLILDEVDTGVSGKIGVSVAKKLIEISKESMVVAISHLPPVIASGDSFYRVYKEDENEKTNTHINKMSKEEALKDLAIILSGKDDDQKAYSLAESLVEEVHTKN